MWLSLNREMRKLLRKSSNLTLYSPNNPRGYVGKINSQTLRAGILSGESGEREVAAYILDQEGFHSGNNYKLNSTSDYYRYHLSSKL